MLALLAIVGATLVAAAPKSRLDVQKILCLNGKRQLCAAWRLYADDNADGLVTNLHGGIDQGGAGSGANASWAEGWLDWTTSSDNTNVAFLINQRYAKLAAHINGATNLFKCPADKYLSAVQTLRGWSQRVRSVSANIGIGEGNAESGPLDPIYKHTKKLSEFLYPSPAEAYVFLDEHPDTMNDPAFFSPHQTSWIDLPATYHNGGAGFAFADCHAEIHTWTGSVSKAGIAYIGAMSPVISGYAGDPDIHWMSYHAERISTSSY